MNGFDCLKCGACCCFFQVVLSDQDLEDVPEELVIPHKTEKGVFIMDGTENGVDTLGKPEQCRVFEPGNKMCRQAREFYGLGESDVGE